MVCFFEPFRAILASKLEKKFKYEPKLLAKIQYG